MEAFMFLLAGLALLAVVGALLHYLAFHNR